MKILRKSVLAAAIVTGLGWSAMTVAGPWGGHGSMGAGCPMMGDGPMMGSGQGRGGEWRHAMRQQRHAERMELLAARLKLKPEQETAWKGFLAAQEARFEARAKARQEMRDKDDTALAHFEERVQFMEKNLTSMKAVHKAAGDLYANLDPSQKQVMDKFFTDRPAWPERGAGRGPTTDAAPAGPQGQSGDKDD